MILTRSLFSHFLKSIRKLVLLSIVFPAVSSFVLAADDWPQWGGPNRNFVITSERLADSWPPEGPRRVWERDLGDGYSGIAVVSGQLFTMIHRGGQEVVVALDASSGKTVWEYPFDVAFLDEMNMDTGPGPHSTPLVVGSRVFTTGTA